MRPKWYPDWRGQTVVIVASGPSAGTVPLTKAKDQARFIAVNSSWKLCPWADILYAGDFKWWEQNGGGAEFGGLRVSIDRRACETWGIARLRCFRSDPRMQFDLGIVGGSNSGLNAYNLAVQLEPSKILLVGFDMTLEYGLHWHGQHPEGLKNPALDIVGKWRRAVDNAAGVVAARGITVINCSPISALKRYPQMGFEEALAA